MVSPGPVKPPAFRGRARSPRGASGDLPLSSLVLGRVVRAASALEIRAAFRGLHVRIEQRLRLPPDTHASGHWGVTKFPPASCTDLQGAVGKAAALMPSAIVCTLLTEAGSRDRLSRQLSDVARLRFFASSLDLQSFVRRSRTDLVIIEAADAAGTDNAGAVAAIRRISRTIPILVLCRMVASHARSLMSLARAGADDIVLEDIDDLAAVVSKHAHRTEDVATVQEVLDDLRLLAPAAAYPVVSHCVANAGRGLRVDTLARALGVSRRTLCNRLAAAGMAPPSTILMWSRLILAAYLLTGTGRSVERVAASSGFASAAAFRVACKRYTGFRPLEIRRANARDRVVQLFLSTQPTAATGRLKAGTNLPGVVRREAS